MQFYDMFESHGDLEEFRGYPGLLQELSLDGSTAELLSTERGNEVVYSDSQKKISKSYLHIGTSSKKSSSENLGTVRNWACFFWMARRRGRSRFVSR